MADYTLKCTGEQLDAAVEKANSAFVALNNKLNKDDVYDGLDSEDASKALSARQGKLLKNGVDNCITYTGANKDINIGHHVFTVGDGTSVYTEITPSSIKITNPIYNSSISPYSLRVNGTTIYWPTVSADPNGKYLALRSDIPSIDDHLSATSTNAVQNKVVNSTISELSYQLAMVRENIFQTVLSEIDYSEDFATLYPIPDTLSDADGTHRVLFSETQLREVAGNSIAYNQLVPLLTSLVNGGVTFTASTDGRKLTLSGTSSVYWTYVKKFNVDVPIGHKVLASIKVKNPNNVFMGYRLRNDSTEIDYYGNDYQQVRTTTKMINQIQFYGNPNIDYGGVEIEDVQLFDLTRMSLDSVTTVEEARSELLKRGIDIDQYNPYSEGEIRNTTASGVKVNGYNLLNLERTEGTLIGFSNKNKRNFDLNKYYLGLSRDGYYDKTKVTSFEISGNQVKFKSTQNGYGVAFPMKVEPGKSYTLSATVTSDTAGYNTGLGIGYYNSEGLNIGFTEIENQSAEKSKAFTTPSSCSLIVVVLYANTHINLTTFSNICFHLSTLRTGYAPYKEPKAISFASTELLGAGEAHDTIEVVEGDRVAGIQRYNLVHVKRIGTVDLGTLSWVSYTGISDKYIYQAPLNDMKLNAGLTCSKLVQVKAVYASGDDYSISSHPTLAKVYARTSNYEETETAFKAAISGVILNYELATPTRTVIAENLTFEEVSATIEQGGSIETIYETLAPNCTTGFVVKKATEVSK